MNDQQKPNEPKGAALGAKEKQKNGAFMKTKIKSIFLLTVFALMAGCAGLIHHPDPLAGWKPASQNPDQVIINDYQNYLQNLPSEEKKYAGPILYFEDGAGQHAVKIMIGINGTVWEHVLIYDKNDKRIKTSVKHTTGGYRS